MERIYASDLLQTSPPTTNYVDLVMDSSEVKALFDILVMYKKVSLHPLPNTLKDTLELGGSLRESGVFVSIENSPFSFERKLRRSSPIPFNLKTLPNYAEMTWRVDPAIGVEAVESKNGDSYVIGIDFPIPDPRTGVLGYILNKRTYIVMDRYEEKVSSGKVVGELGGETYLVRPNRWMTDLVTLRIQGMEAGKVLVNSNELFCRPLGSYFIPVNREEVFKILISLRMRNSQFSLDCLKFIGELA
ncbi:hypothetical protein GWK48_09715 [Metallosphaera tengchongensis]|uniref:Uncharacterized protein n=1 Tax=Metallosphaera tengchongensis TaxID=1532350 RepID=A0A6N0NZQ6_9CREN|nr:hypothetical protein [Metallosphaera tengchongensis]QKR00621.1 hypothetical protein GWK48_09715 [Metallosphaera tengchongensis]